MLIYLSPCVSVVWPLAIGNALAFIKSCFGLHTHGNGSQELSVAFSLQKRKADLQRSLSNVSLHSLFLRFSVCFHRISCPDILRADTDCDYLSDEQRELVLREAQALRALQGHPNIVQCFDFFRVNDNCEICNQTYKRIHVVSDSDCEAFTSENQEADIACEKYITKDGDFASGQHIGKTTNECNAGRDIRRLQSRVGIGKHANRPCVNSRICLVMELLKGGTLVVSAPRVIAERVSLLPVHCLLLPLAPRMSSTPNTTEAGLSAVWRGRQPLTKWSLPHTTALC